MNDRTLLLERFHVALVASIERANPAYLKEEFTIREIHEELIPYRTHRDLIGVAMNGDYEDGLMRLLAGEGEYLTVETPEVLSALQKELDGKAPDTGLFKEFPDAVVRLNPAQLGGTRPPEPKGGVASLFKEREPEAPSVSAEATASDVSSSPPVGTNGWKLDDADAKAPDPGPREARPRPGAAGGADKVETPGQFWSESGSSSQEAADSADRGDDSTEALEAENRRLKILLAERVLEVEELRERLNRQGTRGRGDKP